MTGAMTRRTITWLFVAGLVAGALMLRSSGSAAAEGNPNPAPDPQLQFLDAVESYMPGNVDIYLTEKEIEARQPLLAAVKVVRRAEVGGVVFYQVLQGDKKLLVNPQQIKLIIKAAPTK